VRVGVVEKALTIVPQKGADFAPFFTANCYPGGWNEAAKSYNTSIKDEEAMAATRRRLATSKTAAWKSGDGEAEGPRRPWLSSSRARHWPDSKRVPPHYTEYLVRGANGWLPTLSCIDTCVRVLVTDSNLVQTATTNAVSLLLCKSDNRFP
jgi:hypothetical protein